MPTAWPSGGGVGSGSSFRGIRGKQLTDPQIHPGLPVDFRVLLSGYLPDYVYDLGAIDTNLPFPQLREQSRIRERAMRADADPDFSAKIREGVPAS